MKDIIRIKTGKISPEGLTINTPRGEKNILWTDIELIRLGVISEEAPSVKLHVSGVRKLIQKTLFGKGPDREENIKDIRISHILDIFLKEKNEIIRFDSSYINYKSFLEAVGHVSLRNFKNLLQKISSFAPKHIQDKCFCAFLENKKDLITYYKSLNDFELESFRLKNKQTKAKDPTQTFKEKFKL